MNSRSERGGAGVAGAGISAGFPGRLLNPEIRRRDIAPLEFHSVGRDGAEVNLAIEKPHEDAEDSLRKEIADLDARIQSQTEDVALRIEEARREARACAREEWEREMAERVANERAAVLRSCEQFGGERARYFAGVEAEVVKLALAIAARVLHREVSLDPLLLTAAVRVALEKVAQESGVAVRVPAEDVAAWRRVFEEAAAGSGAELVGDERLGAGECVIDTNVGKVELGVSAQLAEIERGFFDLLQQRPS